ncbi:hypothetical protein HYV43_05010 [Candidatus Micrarchaeota archaeon]|nr:hypothetical protein [Candidatus Micrarchaeota archaeon]
MKIERKVQEISPSASTHQQYDPGKEEAKRFGMWRQAIIDNNRRGGFPFSHHVIRVLKAHVQPPGEPQKAPSPTEQPSRQVDVLPEEQKRAVVQAAIKIRSRGWKPEDDARKAYED